MSEASALLVVPYRICSVPDDEKKRASGDGSVKVVFVQTQPVANALSPSSVQVPVARVERLERPGHRALAGTAVVHVERERR